MRTGKPEHLRAFDAVLAHILRAALDERFEITAYCFMPDHLHLLLEGRADDANGRRFIARAKQHSGFHFRREFGERLWQRYCYEHVLRDEEATLSVVRYILENPLRAGLVASVRDYPFLGSSVYTLEQIVDAVHWAPADFGSVQLQPDDHRSA